MGLGWILELWGLGFSVQSLRTLLYRDSSC